MVNQFSEIDLAYIAGLLDGEGSIFITKTHPEGRRWSRAASPDYAIGVSITNTNKAVLEWVQSLFEGSVYKHGGGTGTWGESKKPVWFWRISRQKALAFLELMQPFLRIKPAQAWLALESAAQTPRHRSRGRGVILTDEELALREGYRLAMHNLNAGTAGI